MLPYASDRVNSIYPLSWAQSTLRKCLKITWRLKALVKKEFDRRREQSNWCSSGHVLTASSVIGWFSDRENGQYEAHSGHALKGTLRERENPAHTNTFTVPVKYMYEWIEFTVLLHWSVTSHTPNMTFHLVTLSWHQTDQFQLYFLWWMFSDEQLVNF